jgi:hypothetical protein
MIKRPKVQFTLLALFLSVTGVATCVALFRRGGVLSAESSVVAVPAIALFLFIASFVPKCRNFRFALLSWSAIAAICALAVVELASGYGTLVAGIWHMPGPPSARTQFVFKVMALGAALGGAFGAGLGVRRATRAEVPLCVVSGVLLVIVIVYLASRLLTVT